MSGEVSLFPGEINGHELFAFGTAGNFLCSLVRSDFE